MKTWCVYKHECPDGRCYVGITGTDPEFRWDGGLGYQYSNWEFFQYILATGWNNIKHRILHENLTEEEAKELEKEEIQKAGKRAFNKVHAPKVYRAIPEVFDDRWATEGEVVKAAIELWADALYGNIDEDARYLVQKSKVIERTILEFRSGDEARIERELEYIERQKAKRIEEEENNSDDS